MSDLEALMDYVTRREHEIQESLIFNLNPNDVAAVSAQVSAIRELRHMGDFIRAALAKGDADG